jgi:hypothetical protein
MPSLVQALKIALSVFSPWRMNVEHQSISARIVAVHEPIHGMSKFTRKAPLFRRTQATEQDRVRL